MLVYLKKFNNLPADLKRKVSDKKTMAVIEALEKKHNILLAAFIMKVMVREIAFDDLEDYLLKENLSKEQAKELAEELKENIFSPLENYFSAGRLRPAAPAAQPPASGAKVKGASFFFSTDDEEEIRKLTQKIIMAENSGLSSWTIDDKLEQIKNRARINFGSADLAERFSQILRTYLRGIRNKLEAKAALMKPFSSGGLNFDEASAEKIMLLSDKVLNSAPDQPTKPLIKIRRPELEKSDFSSGRGISRDAAYDFSKLGAAAGKIKNDLKKIDTNHELAPLAPSVVSAERMRAGAPKVQEKAPILSKNSQFETASVKPVISDISAMPLIKRRFKAENLNQSQKIKIEDVKFVPRVMGPLDEIKYMDLINFRRLDKDPFKSADKIKNKISLLEEENYGKKLEGIRLWRLSPIYRLYLLIGHFSISENKPVDVIIEARKMAGSDYLTVDEFKAIMDLNKSLRL